MGSFSIWNWLIGGPVVVIVVGLAAFLLYLALRKRPAAQSSGDTPAVLVVENPTSGTTPQPQRTTAQKVIAIAYMVGGAFGVLTTLPQLDGASLGLLAALSWMVLLSQIAAALYGGWHFWNGRPVGAQVLYWLSWSCVPVLSFAGITYWCAIGIGAFPTLSLGFGHFSADFNLRFGYASQLWLADGRAGIVIGANLVALAFAILLDKTLQAASIPRWPLQWPKA